MRSLSVRRSVDLHKQRQRNDITLIGTSTIYGVCLASAGGGGRRRKPLVFDYRSVAKQAASRHTLHIQLQCVVEAILLENLSTG